jgi:allantoate deiminase
MRRTSSGHIVLLLIVAIVILRWPGCAHPTGEVFETLDAPLPLHDQLEPAVLHHLLHTEPNSQIRVLSTISDHPSYLKRTFLDAAHRRAATTLHSWMRQAGLTTWMDGLANVRGRAPAVDESTPAILIGSHYDTVVDAGAYDGALGIVVGIAAVKASILSKAVAAGYVTNEEIIKMMGDGEALIDVEAIFPAGATPRLQRPIQVVAFSDEEGVRFQSTFLGSRALSGGITEAYVNSVVDGDGVTLREAIEGLSGATAVDDDLLVAAGRDELRGYVEVHIEQGPVLEAAGERLGVVIGVAGQTWVHVQVRGSQGHAGTVPMGARRDPMPAVGGLVLALEHLCVDRDRQARSEGSLVCTVGKVEVWPGASNVIPGAVNFTADVRSLSDELRQDVVAEFRRAVDKDCRRRELECEFEVRHEAGAVVMDAGLTEALVEAVGKVGIDSKETTISASDTCGSSDRKQKQVIRMPSGAGHDAVAMASIVPVAMLFVRCRGGISHRPDEYTHPDDLAAAAEAMYHMIEDWQSEF